MLEEFLRHRVAVLRRRTQFLLARSRQRKHTVEGLLLAHANIDEVIRVIRTSKTQAEAKDRLMQIETPASLLERALGEEGFASFQSERGVSENYTLTPVQADAILRMTLGSLVNLEQEKLAGEFQKLLDDINEYNRILSDEKNILAMVRDDMQELKRKHGDKRRTEISGEEIGKVDIGDLITEETMVVTISHNGYIKRTATSVYRAQRRGGKGLKGARTEEEDPIEHLFVASTHAYLMFFTNLGRVYWLKVYDLPQLSRSSRGRAVVNLLKLGEGEKIADCRAVRDFHKPGHFLMMATRKGLIKKSSLESYSRPRTGGIIAIKLREGDEVVDVVVTGPGDEVVLSTAAGMAIRFKESDARGLGRNSSGVKGITLVGDDHVVGMVVADPDGLLLTTCAKGYGKRTFFGPNQVVEPEETDTEETDIDETDAEETDTEEIDAEETDTEEIDAEETGPEETDTEGSKAPSSTSRYRTQRRGGKGLRDIKTTERNGPVISIVRANDDDELIMMTARGKLQRIAARDVSTVGRNTQGVRIMSLDEGDILAVIVRVPKEENGDANGDQPTAGEPQGPSSPDSASPESPSPESPSPESPDG